MISLLGPDTSGGADRVLLLGVGGLPATGVVALTCTARWRSEKSCCTVERDVVGRPGRLLTKGTPCWPGVDAG